MEILRLVDSPAKLIISSKIKKVVYGDTYSKQRYEIIEKESYNEKLRNKEPILVTENTINGVKLMKTYEKRCEDV